MKLFDTAELKGNNIIIDGNKYHVISGKHAHYIPDIKAKIIWSRNGRIESYLDWDKGRNRETLLNNTFGTFYEGFDNGSLKSIANEYRIMKMLSINNMAPPVGDMLHIKNMISNYIYSVPCCDVKGVYGYFIDDARYIQKGDFCIDEFSKRFVQTGKIKLSAGAYGDIPKDGNIINGYLIDIRRTIWDMMITSDNDEVDKIVNKIKLKEDRKKIQDKISMLGQFPFKQRSKPYQSYLLGKYISGSRNTLYRFDVMEVSKNLIGKTILDLGCCYGAMSIEAFFRGARDILGIDNQPEYIECARDLAKANGFPINFMSFDLTNKHLPDYINTYFKDPIDIVFALSLYKHIGGKLWNILESTSWKTCYIESNNAPEGMNTGHVKEIINYLKKRDSSINCKCLGKTEDRSPRYVWKLDHI